MPNLMQRGASWLGDRLQGTAGRAVTIQQGVTVVSGLTAWVSQQEHEVFDEGGFMTRVLSHDWSFVAADLGALTLRTGAVVIDTQTGDRYEALPLGKRPCLERADTSGLILTLHTKRSGTGA